MKRVQVNNDVKENDKNIKNKKDLVPKLQPAKEFCKIELPSGKVVDLPVLEGSVGPKSIDGRGFFEKTGLYTFDPGFTSTASCISAITYIDGDLGQLWYRGYAID